jgi:acylphosphatase
MSAKDKNLEQHEIYYSGRVQGVGFRYTARALAGGHRITGFVRNLPDGRVQLVVEGEEEEIQAYIRDIQADMGAYIHGTHEVVRPATGRFQTFEIRF